MKMQGAWLISYVLLWAILLIFAFILVGVLRQIGLIHARLAIGRGVLLTEQGLTPGSVAPDFTLVDLVAPDGAQKQLSDHRGKRVLLLFLRPKCPACEKLLSDLPSVSSDHTRLIGLMESSEADAMAVVNKFKIKYPVLLDERGDVFRQYAVPATPFLCMISEDGKIGFQGVPGSATHVKQLTEVRGSLPTHAGNGAGRALEV